MELHRKVIVFSLLNHKYFSFTFIVIIAIYKKINIKIFYIFHNVLNIEVRKYVLKVNTINIY